MKKKVLGGWVLWMLLGALMLLYPLLSAGVSFVFPPVKSTPAEAEELAGGSGLSRPFGEFRFETVIFSGLYLSSSGDDTPTDWIMCGYLDGKFLPFYVPARGGDLPEDLQNVSYLLRRATAENAVHNEWVVASLADDIADEGYYTTAEAEQFFTTAVLQADRNGALWLQIIALCGLILIAVGSVFLGLRLRRKPEEASPPPVVFSESPSEIIREAVPARIPASKPEKTAEEEPDSNFGFQPLGKE